MRGNAKYGALEVDVPILSNSVKFGLLFIMRAAAAAEAVTGGGSGIGVR